MFRIANKYYASSLLMAGKSTLFNALVGMEKAQAANYPFCTIEPNIASVVMPDPRLEALSKVSHSERCIGIQVEWHDIAGLIAGASQGAGKSQSRVPGPHVIRSNRPPCCRPWQRISRAHSCCRSRRPSRALLLRRRCYSRVGQA